MTRREECKSESLHSISRSQMSPEEFFTKVQHPAVELLTFIIEQEPVLFKLPEELIQDVIAFIRTEENDDDDQAVRSSFAEFRFSSAEIAWSIPISSLKSYNVTKSDTDKSDECSRAGVYCRPLVVRHNERRDQSAALKRDIHSTC